MRESSWKDLVILLFHVLSAPSLPQSTEEIVQLLSPLERCKHVGFGKSSLTTPPLVTPLAQAISHHVWENSPPDVLDFSALLSFFSQRFPGSRYCPPPCLMYVEQKSLRRNLSGPLPDMNPNFQSSASCRFSSKPLPIDSFPFEMSLFFTVPAALKLIRKAAASFYELKCASRRLVLCVGGGLFFFFLGVGAKVFSRSSLVLFEIPPLEFSSSLPLATPFSCSFLQAHTIFANHPNTCLPSFQKYNNPSPSPSYFLPLLPTQLRFCIPQYLTNAAPPPLMTYP